MVPGTQVLGNAGARGGWMADVEAVPSRLLALGLGKIEVILSVVHSGRKKLRPLCFLGSVSLLTLYSMIEINRQRRVFSLK